jgi:hypothetical protein
MKIKYFKLKYPILFWMTIIGIIHCFTYKLFLIEIPEPNWFPKASEIGDIFYNLQLGFLTSIIFFYLVIFLKETKQRALVCKKVEYHTYLIISEGLSLYFNFRKGEIDSNFPPSMVHCEKLCRAHNQWSTKTKDSHGTNLSWRTLIEDKYENIMDQINNLNDLPITISYFQNDDLISIISRLKDANLFTFYRGKLRAIWNEPKSDESGNISRIQEKLFELFQIIFELMELHQKEFGPDSLSKLKKSYL